MKSKLGSSVTDPVIDHGQSEILYPIKGFMKILRHYCWLRDNSVQHWASLWCIVCQIIFCHTAKGDGFAQNLQKLVAAARQDFKDVRDEPSKEVTDDGDQTYTCVILIPDFDRGTVWYYKDPDLVPSVRFHYTQELINQSVGQEKYNDLRQKVLDALPSDCTSGERESGSTVHYKRFVVRASDGSMSVSVQMRSFKSTGDIDIDLIISSQNRNDQRSRLPGADQPKSPADSIRLVLNGVDLTWHPHADQHTVDFKLPYQNISDKTVKCEVKVSSGHRPRSAASDDYSEWEEKFEKSYVFILKPGETTNVTGTLDWFRTPDTMPVLRYPNNRATSKDLLKAEYVQEP
jgi:hypothetical protein